MSDVENEMEVLQRRLAAKTREIEALVAKQQGLSVLNAMETALIMIDCESMSKN